MPMPIRKTLPRAAVRKQLALIRADLDQALSRVSILYNGSDETLRDQLITLQTAVRAARDVVPSVGEKGAARWVNVEEVNGASRS